MRKNSSTSGWSALAAKNCLIRGVCCSWDIGFGAGGGGRPASVPEAIARLETGVRSVRHPRNLATRCVPVLYVRSEEHTSELQSLMRSSYALICLQKKK